MYTISQVMFCVHSIKNQCKHGLSGQSNRFIPCLSTRNVAKIDAKAPAFLCSLLLRAQITKGSFTSNEGFAPICFTLVLYLFPR
jgi:hypothetical protein